MENYLNTGISLLVIIVGSFTVSIFGGFSLYEEVEWYKSHGYHVESLRYEDFISRFDEDFTLIIHDINRQGVREQAEYIYNKYGEINVFFDTDKRIIYFLAHYHPEIKNAMIFMWRASTY